MKETRNRLMSFYGILLLLAGVLYVLGDWMNIDMAFLADTGTETRFIVSTAMILVTLAFIPLGLRLMKFRRVSSDVRENGLMALRKWSLVRMAMIGCLLVVNTALYYAFGFEPAFGYLAVVLLLTMPFILPTIERCKAELEGCTPQEPTTEITDKSV